MSASLLRASAISGVLRLRAVLDTRSDLTPAEAAAFLRQTSANAVGVDLDAGCELLALIPPLTTGTPEGVFRACIAAIAKSAAPGWLSALPLGRQALGDSLDENTRQCFRIAGAFDPVPQPEVLLWLDELASAQFALTNRGNLIVGREGELLTLESEIRKLKALSIAKSPTWVALDDNRAGFDIKSWRRDPDGNETPLLIEVKACSGQSCRFFLTRNEWRSACRFPHQYELHVWRLADNASAIFKPADIGHHIPHDNGTGQWESVQVQLGPQVFQGKRAVTPS